MESASAVRKSSVFVTFRSFLAVRHTTAPGTLCCVVGCQLLWKDKTCPARTYAYHELASVNIDITIVICVVRSGASVVLHTEGRAKAGTYARLLVHSLLVCRKGFAFTEVGMPTLTFVHIAHWALRKPQSCEVSCCEPYIDVCTSHLRVSLTLCFSCATDSRKL